MLPSLIEATSISGLEAMSVGKPIIGTSVGGIPELGTHGETRFLVLPSDPDTLANSINMLIVDEMLRRQVGGYGRSAVEAQFSRDRIADKTLNIYEEAASKNRKKPQAIIVDYVIRGSETHRQARYMTRTDRHHNGKPLRILLAPLEIGANCRGNPMGTYQDQMRTPAKFRTWGIECSSDI